MEGRECSAAMGVATSNRLERRLQADDDHAMSCKRVACCAHGGSTSIANETSSIDFQVGGRAMIEVILQLRTPFPTVAVGYLQTHAKSPAYMSSLRRTRHPKMCVSGLTRHRYEYGVVVPIYRDQANRL